MPLNFAANHFFTITLDFEPDFVVNCTIFCFHACAQPKFGLVFFWFCFCLFFFWLIHSQFFSCSFSFPFSLPFFSLYLLPFIPFLFSGRVLASTLQKTWKQNIDQLQVTWPILPPILHPKLNTFFWNSSARIWSMLKMDTGMDGTVLVVLAAYQNNLVTSKNDGVTSGSMSTPPNVNKSRLPQKKC